MVMKAVGRGNHKCHDNAGYAVTPQTYLYMCNAEYVAAYHSDGWVSLAVVMITKYGIASCAFTSEQAIKQL